MFFTTEEDLSKPPTLYEKVGQQLSFYISRDRESYSTVAHVALRDYRTVQKWASGKGAPDLVEAKRLHDAFGWSFNL